MLSWRPITPMAGSLIGGCLPTLLEAVPQKNQNRKQMEVPFLDRYIMVLLGGATGSLMRYVLGTAIMARIGGRFPAGTIFINITGSFLIGFLMTLWTDRLQPHPNWRFLLVAGFLGGYTTFSSLEWETLSLVRDGGKWLGLLNVVGSVVLGYVAVWLGAAIASKR